MLSLNKDVWTCITLELSNRDKVNISSICLSSRFLVQILDFNDCVRASKIINLPYKFKNICIDNSMDHIKILQPSTITHMKFSYNFNSEIKFIIPNSVVHLVFGYKFNKIIHNGQIPNSVVHLVFGHNYNKPITDCIPTSVTHLTLGREFKKSICGHIPLSVTHLVLKCVNLILSKNDIPLSVTHLTLDYSFNFNNSMQNCIPLSVTHLILAYYSNININDMIPSSVTHLTLHCVYELLLESDVPNSVTHLTLSDNYGLYGHGLWSSDYISTSVTHLVLDTKIISLPFIPPSVKFLKIRSIYAGKYNIPNTVNTVEWI